MYFMILWWFFFLEPLPPSFTVNPPNDIVVFAESKVNMTCEAFGIPVPVVTWYRDGIPVPKENTAEVKGISQFTLESFTSDQQEEYWCEARNLKDWKRSSIARLKLKRRKRCHFSLYFISLIFFLNRSLLSHCWLAKRRTRCKGCWSIESTILHCILQSVLFLERGMQRPDSTEDRRLLGHWSRTWRN